MFSSVASGVRPVEDMPERLLRLRDRSGDGQNVVADAEFFRELRGIAQAPFARIAGGKRDAPDAFRPERLGGDHGDERRVDAAGEAEHDRLEAALGDVVAHAEDERAEELFFLVGGKGWRGHALTGAATIDHEHVLGEAGAEGEQVALRVERDAVAVEDQLVVRADHVDLHEWHTFVARDPLQHGEPGRLLAAFPGRGGDVDDERRAGVDEFVDGIVPVTTLGPEIGVVPDVLADGQRDFLSRDFDWGNFLRRIEVTVLVEDVVGRQERLHHAMDDLSVLEDGGGVAQAAPGPERIAVDVASNERNVAYRQGEQVEAFEAARKEIVAQEQVAGRVAAEKKLGARGRVPLLCRRPRDRPPPVARGFYRTRRWWR